MFTKSEFRNQEELDGKGSVRFWAQSTFFHLSLISRPLDSSTRPTIRSLPSSFAYSLSRLLLTLERNNDWFRSSLPRHRLPISHLLLPRRPRRPATLLLPQRLVRSLLAHDAESSGHQGTQGRFDAGFEVDRPGFAGRDCDCGVFDVPTVRWMQRAASEVGIVPC